MFSVNIIDNAKDFDEPAQVLYVSLISKNKKKTGYEILNSIADLYLDASIEMRKNEIIRGLGILRLKSQN